MCRYSNLYTATLSVSLGEGNVLPAYPRFHEDLSVLPGGQVQVL